MRSIGVLFIITLIICGCAGNPAIPPVNDQADIPDLQLSGVNSQAGNHRLWGEWEILIDADHTHAEAIPIRSGRFHLNALKFLEEYCTDCLKILGLHKNGDGTIDMMVQITHPFDNHPEYTGFDVKGIIMFDGSWENEGYKYYLPYPEPFRISWRKLGDPQVLNADGFTIRWSPWYDSGMSQPIFNYWEGRFANGTPTANVNAYKNFYTDEDRHMFRVNHSVVQTYRIALPPGPVVAGYAVEACWEPPTTTPVTNPAEDFPLTANQPEPYEFYFNLYNGEVIDVPHCCGDAWDPSDTYMVVKQWYQPNSEPEFFALFADYYHSRSGEWPPCGDEWPNWYCANGFNADNFADGDYIGVVVNYWAGVGSEWPFTEEIAYTVFEFTIDLE
jgi:hypothetical protein